MKSEKVKAIKSQQFEETARMFVRRSSNGQFALAKNKGWVAAPFESSSHFSSLEEENLLRSVGTTTRLIACALEKLDQFPSTLEVPVTQSGIKDFNAKTAHFNFALFPEDMSWIIICTTDDFFVVAGSQEFIEKFSRESLKNTFCKFSEFINEDLWNDVGREKMFSLYNSLHDEYTDAHTGIFVNLI